ncbi:acyl carrier protein [Breznakia pachnodae]|uniref:Acyl carrier protein n=1 Tax=Breznakia pachnodae TaxID=265178 RepID=A0ABU0E3Q4_9FIRM|nr:acyl carrier protein [Breznakia pachnodae]MDQ0361528.1 acyl carrier protein [Breznakia pachnodae]
MVKQSILKIIKNCIEREQVHVTNVTIESSLVDDLFFDSLSFIRLLIEIEDHFSIEIESIDYKNIKKVSDLIEAVEKYI